MLGTRSIDATDATGKTALWRSIERAKTADFEKLLKSGADVNKTYHSRQSPLMFAVEKENVEYLQALLKAGANFDSVNTFGMSAVMIAAKSGHLDCLRILVDAGASLLFRDIRGRTALLIAVEENRCECTKYLIEAGANIHQHDSKGITALMVAIHENCDKCVQSLVHAGASVDEFSKSGKTPLMIAAERGSSVLPVLIQLGANIDLGDGRGRTSAIHATCAGHVNSLLQLVQAGANLDLADDQRQTPLMIAAKSGNLECVKCLAKGGAKLELQDSDGKTALMLAAAGGHYHILKTLLKCGKQWKDMQSKTKRTALIYAVEGLHEVSMQQLSLSTTRTVTTHSGYSMPGFANAYQSHIPSKCLQVLLAAGADPNICDIDGLSPLMHAAKVDTSGGLFQQLIEAGADIHLTDKCYKRTALLLAAFHGNVKYVRKLVEAGAQVNVGSCNGETPLMYLTIMCSNFNSIYDTIVFLLDHGAEVDAQDNSGRTALMCAARSSKGIFAMSLLIKRGANVNKTNNAGYCALDQTIGHHDDFFLNAQYLLEKGAIPNFTSGGNGESTVSLAIRSQNISFLLLILRNNSEAQLEWDDFYYIMTATNRRLLQVVVLESMMPSYIVPSMKRCDDSLSILRTALNLGCLGVAKYLLAIGYLNIFDIHYEKPNSRVLRSRSYWRRDPQLKPFLKRLYSQPWPLVKLAFVVVSTNMGTSPKRKDRIKSSGLPGRLQNMLLFQEPIAKLCTKHWDSIPICFNPQNYEKLPKPRPLLYYWPFGQDITPCDCSECSQAGYKFDY